ncbi:Dot/Icm type IV secretion system effector PhnB [Variovorax defluvii]|uniref:Dot/Icm type IV secretion system effector PhnB n=1 Tax=Variovorax defluvii TaxID=913761 RepID=A0ABP8IC66_9BURK
MAVHELFAYLCVNDTAKAIAWYGEVLGTTEKFRLTEPSGRIGHAELDLGGTTLMLCDEFPEYGIRGPLSIGATAVSIHLHVDDADALVERAVKAGATLEIAVQDQFYGERSGAFKDPFGHRWNVGHGIEELSPEEMQRRYTELLGSP